MAGHPIDVHVGAKLRELRMQRRVSQMELAGRVGVTFQQIQKYEKGVNRISASKLFELAECLGVEVQEFFAGLPPGGGSKAERAAVPRLSAMDYEILALLGRIDDSEVKKQIRGIVFALVDREKKSDRVSSSRG
jgi:transcriptional regulator with XRE-family HTH domain